MLKFIALFAAVCGLSAAPVLAAEQGASDSKPAKLTDGQLDQVKGGDPLIYVGVFAPIDVHVEPITVSIPVNVAAVVQANVLGNASFQGLAVGTQNNFNLPPLPIPGG